MLRTDEVLDKHKHDKSHRKGDDKQQRVSAIVILNHAGLQTLCAAEKRLVFENVSHDFAECERHNGKIVAFQTKARQTDDKAEHRGKQASEKHGKNQNDQLIGNRLREQESKFAADIRADTHKAGMSQAELAQKADHEVQRNRKDDAEADLRKERCIRHFELSGKVHP